MRVNTQQALAAGAMETFTKLLDHASEVIRAKAARDIMDLRYTCTQNLILLLIIFKCACLIKQSRMKNDFVLCFSVFL